MKFIKLKESLEDTFQLYQLASDYKCKLSHSAVDEFLNEEECLKDMKRV